MTGWVGPPISAGISESAPAIADAAAPAMEAAGEAGGGMLLPLTAVIEGAKALGSIISGGPTTGSPQMSGNGSVAPQRTSGFFGIGARTIPGLVSPPNPAVYANAAPVQAMPNIPQAPGAPQLLQGQATQQMLPMQPQARTGGEVPQGPGAQPQAPQQPMQFPPAQQPLTMPTPQGPPQQLLPMQPQMDQQQPLQGSVVMNVGANGRPMISAPGAPPQQEAAPQAPQQPNYPPWAAPLQQMAPALQGLHNFFTGLPDQLSQAAEHGFLPPAEAASGMTKPPDAQNVSPGQLAKINQAAAAGQLDPNTLTKLTGGAINTPPEMQKAEWDRMRNQAVQNTKILSHQMAQQDSALSNLPGLTQLVGKYADELSNAKIQSEKDANDWLARNTARLWYGDPGDPAHGVPPTPAIMRQVQKTMFAPLRQRTIEVGQKRTDGNPEINDQAMKLGVGTGPVLASPLEYRDVFRGKVADSSREMDNLHVTEADIEANIRHRREIAKGPLPWMVTHLIGGMEEVPRELRREAKEKASAAVAGRRDFLLKKQKADQDIVDSYDKLEEEANKRVEKFQSDLQSKIFDAYKKRIEDGSAEVQGDKVKLDTVVTLTKLALDEQTNRLNALLGVPKTMEAIAGATAALNNAHTNAERVKVEGTKIDQSVAAEAVHLTEEQLKLAQTRLKDMNNQKHPPGPKELAAANQTLNTAQEQYRQAIDQRLKEIQAKIGKK